MALKRVPGIRVLLVGLGAPEEVAGSGAGTLAPVPGVSLERVVRRSGLGEATHVSHPDSYLLSSVCG